MAKMLEEIIVIKLSKLVKDNDDTTDTIADGDVIAALEQVAQELAGNGVFVEVEKA